MTLEWDHITDNDVNPEITGEILNPEYYLRANISSNAYPPLISSLSPPTSSLLSSQSFSVSMLSSAMYDSAKQTISALLEYQWRLFAPLIRPYAKDRRAYIRDANACNDTFDDMYSGILNINNSNKNTNGNKNDDNPVMVEIHPALWRRLVKTSSLRKALDLFLLLGFVPVTSSDNNKERNSENGNNSCNKSINEKINDANKQNQNFYSPPFEIKDFGYDEICNVPHAVSGLKFIFTSQCGDNKIDSYKIESGISNNNNNFVSNNTANDCSDFFFLKNKNMLSSFGSNTGNSNEERKRNSDFVKNSNYNRTTLCNNQTNLCQISSNINRNIIDGEEKSIELPKRKSTNEEVGNTLFFKGNDDFSSSVPASTDLNFDAFSSICEDEEGVRERVRSSQFREEEGKFALFIGEDDEIEIKKFAELDSSKEKDAPSTSSSFSLSSSYSYYLSKRHRKGSNNFVHFECRIHSHHHLPNIRHNHLNQNYGIDTDGKGEDNGSQVHSGVVGVTDNVGQICINNYSASTSNNSSNKNSTITNYNESDDSGLVKRHTRDGRKGLLMIINARPIVASCKGKSVIFLQLNKSINIEKSPFFVIIKEASTLSSSSCSSSFSKTSITNVNSGSSFNPRGSDSVINNSPSSPLSASRQIVKCTIAGHNHLIFVAPPHAIGRTMVAVYCTTGTTGAIGNTGTAGTTGTASAIGTIGASNCEDEYGNESFALKRYTNTVVMEYLDVGISRDNYLSCFNVSQITSDIPLTSSSSSSSTIVDQFSERSEGICSNFNNFDHEDEEGKEVGEETEAGEVPDENREANDEQVMTDDGIEGGIGNEEDQNESNVDDLDDGEDSAALLYYRVSTELSGRAGTNVRTVQNGTACGRDNGSKGDDNKQDKKNTDEENNDVPCSKEIFLDKEFNMFLDDFQNKSEDVDDNNRGKICQRENGDEVCLRHKRHNCSVNAKNKIKRGICNEKNYITEEANDNSNFKSSRFTSDISSSKSNVFNRNNKNKSKRNDKVHLPLTREMLDLFTNNIIIPVSVAGNVTNSENVNNNNGIQDDVASRVCSSDCQINHCHNFGPGISESSVVLTNTLGCDIHDCQHLNDDIHNNQKFKGYDKNKIPQRKKCQKKDNHNTLCRNCFNNFNNNLLDVKEEAKNCELGFSSRNSNFSNCTNDCSHSNYDNSSPCSSQRSFPIFNTTNDHNSVLSFSENECNENEIADN